MIDRFKRRLVGGILPALCLAAGLASALPAAAMTQFRGGGFLSEFTPECAADGWGGIHMVTARYRPSGLPMNGDRTRLSVFTEWGAFNFNTEGRFSNTMRAVDAIAIFSSPWRLENPHTRMRLLPGSTTNLGNATSLVTLIGEMENFGEVEDCSVRFRLYMSRHN